MHANKITRFENIAAEDAFLINSSISWLANRSPLCSKEEINKAVMCTAGLMGTCCILQQTEPTVHGLARFPCSRVSAWLAGCFVLLKS